MVALILNHVAAKARRVALEAAEAAGKIVGDGFRCDRAADGVSHKSETDLVTKVDKAAEVTVCSNECVLCAG